MVDAETMGIKLEPKAFIFGKYFKQKIIYLSMDNRWKSYCFKTASEKNTFIDTVGSKTIRALFEVIRVKKLMPITLSWNKCFSIHDLRLYTAYNKHEMIKIDNQSREKTQVLSQVL